MQQNLADLGRIQKPKIVFLFYKLRFRLFRSSLLLRLLLPWHHTVSPPSSRGYHYPHVSLRPTPDTISHDRLSQDILLTDPVSSGPTPDAIDLSGPTPDRPVVVRTYS
eukprot:6653418-Pyramimonas_sp.AAC.1